MDTRVLSRGGILTTRLHPVPKLRISGAIPIFPLYAFKAWIWTSLALPQTEVFQNHCNLDVWSNRASGVYVASTSRLDAHWALVCGAYPQFVLATLSVLRTVNHLMIRWLEGMWKESVTVFHPILLKGLRKTTKSLSRYSRIRSRGANHMTGVSVLFELSLNPNCGTDHQHCACSIIRRAIYSVWTQLFVYHAKSAACFGWIIGIISLIMARY